MKVAICDGDKVFCEQLSGYIQAWAQEILEQVELIVYKTAEEFLFAWSPAQEFDLLFLCIQLNGMSGIDLAHLVRRIDKDMAIVFITENSDYVYDGYTVGALRYLLKPIQRADCVMCLEQIYQKSDDDSEESILIASDTKIYKVLCSQITYVEASGHYVEIHMKNGTLKCRKNISELVDELQNKNFVYVHRSYIVNARYIRVISKKNVELENGVVVPVSRLRAKEVKDTFVSYYHTT